MGRGATVSAMVSLLESCMDREDALAAPVVVGRGPWTRPSPSRSVTAPHGHWTCLSPSSVSATTGALRARRDHSMEREPKDTQEMGRQCSVADFLKHPEHIC